MSLQQAWNTLFDDDKLREVILESDERLHSLIKNHGWQESLLKSLAPLYFAQFFSGYSHLYLSHPGKHLPYSSDCPGTRLLEHGMILIGNTGSRDWIVVNAVEASGSVSYISYAEFDDRDFSNLKEVTRLVAGSVSEYLFALHCECAPLDYYDEQSHGAYSC